MTVLHLLKAISSVLIWHLIAKKADEKQQKKKQLHKSSLEYIVVMRRQGLVCIVTNLLRKDLHAVIIPEIKEMHSETD